MATVLPKHPAIYKLIKFKCNMNLKLITYNYY